MSKHGEYLQKLLPLAVKYQGTTIGKEIKQMYFRILQDQLYRSNPSTELFSEKAILDVIYGGDSLEADFDPKLELVI